MPSTVKIADREVECADGQPILDALLRAGVWMPNSCNQGTCGTCKLQVRQGDVDHANSPLDTLTEDERAEGLALGCQARPSSEFVEVALRGGEPKATNPLRDFTATVTTVEEIAHDTRRVVLTLDEPLVFDAGQYVELTVPGSDHKRQYSLANRADEDKHLELHIRRVEGGVASDRWLFSSVDVGHQVEVSGPLGDFHLPAPDDDDGEPMVLIGGGTGLAPLIGIARTALERNPDREIVLYHGVRSEQDLYATEVFEEIAARHPTFAFRQVLSDPEGQTVFRTGFPTDHFVEDMTSAKGWSGWLCGPPPLVEAGVKAFKRRRMAPRLIHREKFTPADVIVEAD